MLNKEKYMNELLEFACTDNKLAITKDGKLRECRGVRCNECAFETMVWLVAAIHAESGWNRSTKNHRLIGVEFQLIHRFL